MREIQDVYKHSQNDLIKMYELNDKTRQKIQFQMQQTLNQMVELKLSSDGIENKLYDYLQLILSQLKAIYTQKSSQLKQNYLELMK